MRLLIVEDAQKLSSVLQRAFREDGYAVDVEALGGEAVWRATETEFDAIILDVGLPDITGFEVCRQLRGRGSRPRTPSTISSWAWTAAPMTM